MRSMRSIVLVTVVALAAGSASAADRPAFSALPRELQELLRAWQRQDCRNDDRRLVEGMRRAGPALEEALWETYDVGPTPEARDELDATVSDRWHLRRDWLESRDAKVVDAEIAEQLLAQSEEDFRLQEDAKLRQRWHDAALSGLAQVCTERSIERLQSIAFDERDPSSSVARITLETSGGCSGNAR
jgi:hypothetical protein